MVMDREDEVVMARVQSEQDHLTDLAFKVVKAMNVEYNAEMRISSVSMRISNDGSVYATANLRISRYVSARQTRKRLIDEADET